MKTFHSLIILTLVTGCTTSESNIKSRNINNNNNNSVNLSEITMIELDETKEFPIHTIISLTNEKKPHISYTKKIVVASYNINDVKKRWGESAFKRIEKSWTRDFSVSDLKYISRYADGLKIFVKNEKEFLSARSNKTCNHNNVRFYIKSKTKEENSFTIPGNLLCQKTTIMIGFKKFIKEMNSLVLKYKPNLNMELAAL
ncbi:hypothetical protein [Candidatus Marithrix sp. Canyon 246]|uniref:hypothetical protein n=1 Tax=Candidatus Marithrix sp. Canyon 246 TaxID=1827136 RepID=UPI00084A158A|nr:hypothetical protein [Candidatus Marithrix sp. Canyon 246]